MRVGVGQTLKVMGETDGGWWVGDRSGAALLATRHAPEGTEVGQRIEVFVYSDKEGLPLATPTMPKVQRGQIGPLQVVDVARHGAYLDWGLERDLFVPFGLQHRPLAVGDTVVVAVDVDPDGRVFASSRLVEYLATNPTFAPGEEVDLLIYGFNELGSMAVVNGRYNGLLYRNETFRPVSIGEITRGWVKAVRPDGRIDVTLHRTARGGTLDAKDVVWAALEAAGGYLALTDRSDPEAIQDRLQISKKAFKKAVGALYKERRITLEDGGIRVAEG